VEELLGVVVVRIQSLEDRDVRGDLAIFPRKLGYGGVLPRAITRSETRAVVDAEGGDVEEARDADAPELATNACGATSAPADDSNDPHQFGERS
jgi:hypothetical protein